jgi:hypothetical protein
MKSIFLGLLLMVPLSARCEIIREDFCFTSSGAKSMRFEFHAVYDQATRWSGAFVKYEKSREPISLVLRSTQEVVVDSDRPSDITEDWLEVSGDGITGEYEIVSQGANVYSVIYTSRATQEKFYFNLDPDATPSDKGCAWR